METQERTYGDENTLTILDFGDAKVRHYTTRHKDREELEAILVDRGYNLNNVEWMLHSGDTQMCGTL